MSPLAPSRFVMRAMEMNDVDVVTAWLQDVDDLSLFDRSVTVPPGKDVARESWREDLAAAKFPTSYWFMVEAPDRTPVALGGLQSVNYIHGDATLPILISKASRGQGIGLWIAYVLLETAFDRLRLRRVTTFFRADNARTERLTQRAGFREEGRLRQAWLTQGQFIDCMVVGLLREEWYARREALRTELNGSVEVVMGSHASAAPALSGNPPAEKGGR